MNRSILIVICDFLVLCALSLSSGLNEQTAQITPPIPGFQYTAAAKDARSAVALEDYRKLQQETDALKKQLSSVRETSGKESERMNRELAGKNRKLLKTEQQLAAAAAALKNEQKVSAEKESDLKRTRQNLQDARELLTETKVLAAERGKDIERQRRELDTAKTDLKQKDAELYKVQLTANQKDRELALANQQIGHMKKNAEQTSLVLNNLQIKYDKERQQSKQTAVELAKMQASLAGMTEQSRLLRKKLAEAEEQLRSRSIEKYLSAVVRLDSHIANIRPLLGRHVTDSTQYLPEIQLGKQIFLPGVLLPVIGLDQNFSGHTKISELSYTVSKVKGKPDRYSLSAPFLIPDEAPQMCLIPVKQSSKAPLNVICRSQLKKRGLRNLTLFKKRSLGTETAELAERCSFDNTHGSGYLLVRNSLRNSTQLPAEPGDVIITKEGFLAAVVIGLSSEKNGIRYAFCFVFPDQGLQKTKGLPVVKQKSETVFSDFMRLSESYRQNAEKHLKKNMKDFTAVRGNFSR